MKDFFEEYGLTAVACIGGILGLTLLMTLTSPDSKFAQLIGRFIERLMGI